MSAAGAMGRSRRLSVLSFVAFALPWTGMAELGRAQQATTSPPTAALADWDGETALTTDALRLHALEIGDLLEQASARVDRLAGETSDRAEGGKLLDAIREELDLSRQWNHHLMSILLEVAEARRALDVRERTMAAEIFELTSIAEEARLELIALWQSLRPGTPIPFDEPGLPGDAKPKTSRPSAPEHEKHRLDTAAEALRRSGRSSSNASRVLDEINPVQESAAGNTEAVRTGIIDALGTVALHHRDLIESDVLEGGRIDDGLSSKEITAWAASIASKMHHEGYQNFEPTGGQTGTIQTSRPNVEDMVVEGEILSTGAIRIAPDRRALPIATVTAGSLVLVTGKVIDQDWYRVKTESGRLGYISGDLIRHQSQPSKTGRRIKSS
ncbi:MAG: SH3 domain-containing protein [Geminicoccaceae bacterium]